LATFYNSFLIAIKAATFIPLAALIYYADYSKWLNYFFLSSASIALAGFVVASISLFLLGVVLKRKIVATYLQLSNNNIILGAIVLAFAAGLFVLGTLFSSSQDVLFAYESLISFGVAYTLLRSDVRLVKLVWPLFVLLGIAPLTLLLSEVMGGLIAGLIILLGMLGLFDAFIVGSLESVSENLRLLCLPGFMALFGFAYWLLSPAIPLLFILLIPASLIFLAVPKIGSWINFSPIVFSYPCPGHSNTDESGFCLTCGRKFSPMKKQTPSGFAGLIITIIVLGILLTTQIPVLILSVSGPSISAYDYSGVTSRTVPSTPNGWLVNSSAVMNKTGDLYSVEKVYVPAHHPEVKNYTMYFALATSSQPVTVSLGEIPGFNRSSQDLNLGGYVGRLYTYNSTENVIIAYEGTTNFRYLVGSSFSLLGEGVTFVRNFTKVNSTTAQQQVISDLNSIFLPLLGAQSTPYAWTDFLFRASETLSLLSALFLIFLTSAGIFMGAFMAKQYDFKTDSFDTRASSLDDTDWRLLSTVLESPRPLTTLEIASQLKLALGGKGRESIRDTELSLETLEARNVLRRGLFERKSEILAGWQAII